MANKLRYEESPYLKQHQNNPVNWYPWGAEAFEVAKRENKLIFLSIGYSAKDDTIIKSSQQNLKGLIGFDFKYPYTLLKPTLNSSFELCTNKACFGTYRSLVELKEHI
jgi:hypothetical protein